MPNDAIWNPGLGLYAILFAPAWKDMFPFFGAHCESLLGNKKLIQDLEPKKYDLAIVDLVWNECSIGFARRTLNIPVVVGFWGLSPTTLEVDTRPNFITSSHLPLMTPFPNIKNAFFNRMINTFMKLIAQFVMRLYQSHIHSAMNKYIPNAESPLELHQGLDGVLMNSDPAIEITRLLPPNHIYVGGMQMEMETNTTDKIPEVIFSVTLLSL